jgi:signal transduction histidine kinase
MITEYVQRISGKDNPDERTAVPTQPKVKTAVAAETDNDAQTKPWLPLFLWAGSMAFVVAGLVLLGLNWHTAVPPRWGFRGFQTLFAIPVVAGGAFLARRRPRNPIGWFILASGIVGAFIGFGEEYAAYALLTRPGSLSGGVIVAGISNWLWIFSMGLGVIYIPLYFPSGRLLSSRWRIVAWLGALWMVLGSLRLIIEPGPLDNMRFVINPFSIEKLASQLSWLSLNATLGVGLLIMGAATLSLILRYRRSGGEVRLQIKWVAYAAALMPLSGIVGQFDGWFADLILFLIVLAFPVATWIAILRYRLYDIDLLINRTLVYGALTVCIVAVYALVVGAVGTLFQTQGNWLITLIATGLVAVLFQPLRERWQQWVNQLLYGRRDEPFEVLASLGKRLEDTMSPETIYPTIVESVAQTLKLPYVALTVKKGEAQQTVESFGKPAADPESFPLTYQGTEIGQLLAARRAPDEPFTEGEERLLRNMARQAGTAVHAHQLTADLQRARQQIVTSREEERRRLRRDLHDGLGPTLASHMLKIGSARAMLNNRPTMADKLLAEMETDIENTLADVRRIVYDLRPPALDQWGLVGALRAYAETCANGGPSTLAIRVNAPDALPPLPAAVEVAAYHIAREGLTNVVRHAQARRCVLRLTVDDGDNGRLHLSIKDDGKGLPNHVPTGVGLLSMRERAEELGGSCLLRSSINGGTEVTAVLPLRNG